MHDIEPFFRWRDYYTAAEDERSPFFGREYSEFSYSNAVYNFYIHPQWDEFGSDTLYLKILFVDYDMGFAIIELIGEWNDAVGNDIMWLRRRVTDPLTEEGVFCFVFIAENVLNFHGDDDAYYEDWLDNLRDEQGWVVVLNGQEHVLRELRSTRLDDYMYFFPPFDDINWRTMPPANLFELLDGLVQKGQRRIY